MYFNFDQFDSWTLEKQWFLPLIRDKTDSTFWLKVWGLKPSFTKSTETKNIFYSFLFILFTLFFFCASWDDLQHWTKKANKKSEQRFVEAASNYLKVSLVLLTATPPPLPLFLLQALNESATTNIVEEKNEGTQKDMSRKIGSKKYAALRTNFNEEVSSKDLTQERVSSSLTSDANDSQNTSSAPSSTLASK